MPPFLSVQQLAGMWRPLTHAQEEFAELAVQVASDRVRDLKPGLADDDAAAQLVVFDMVKTAIVTGRYPGHSSYQESAGGSSLSGSLTAAGGSLVLTDAHKRMLGAATSGEPKWFFGDRS